MNLLFTSGVVEQDEQGKEIVIRRDEKGQRVVIRPEERLAQGQAQQGARHI
jgi:dUTPase